MEIFGLADWLCKYMSFGAEYMHRRIKFLLLLFCTIFILSFTLTLIHYNQNPFVSQQTPYNSLFYS